MIVVTGVAGFIGSCMLSKLNREGITDVVIVDDFSKKDKSINYERLKYSKQIDRSEFIEWFELNAASVDAVCHLGARTDTTEFDWEVFLKLNLDYTKSIWRICTQNNIPMVYASSAATYGGGELGYDDDLTKIPLLQPLNPYGRSKQEFDVWALAQENTPPFWAGLKFFNVYGPNEYHKGRMASVVMHSYNQIRETGLVKLFRSHRSDFQDGMQMRDFVYVLDVVDVLYFLLMNRPKSDIYNLGSGKARSFYDLAAATFDAMGEKVNVEYIDIPIDIRDKYQYFTEANMEKLKSVGYSKAFHTLEEGVRDYVQNYLIGHRHF
ncbi:MAG: ADP-glyceromanno-heptose 6-epimerase [Bacteroidales bacterium]|nr:ADP-glyceromanno-heptose 6-epimerase [Bacteroidales bacterium]